MKNSLWFMNGVSENKFFGNVVLYLCLLWFLMLIFWYVNVNVECIFVWKKKKNE